MMAESNSITALHQQLDALWICYLDLLDQYTQSQQNIKKYLSQGFFSLAQANFTSSGRRYGQDFYDQRAVASSRVRIVDDANSFLVRIADIKVEAPAEKSTAANLPTPKPEDGEDGEDEPKIEKSSTQLPTPEPEEISEEEQPRKPSDPLRQFGILIPAALRSAQRSFAKVVRNEDALVQAINSAKGLREVEMEIRKARKVLKKAERDATGGTAP